MVSTRRLLLTAALAGAATIGLSHRAGAAVGLPANVVTFTPNDASVQTYPSVQYGPGGSSTTGQTSWRVVNGLGNGAEKFVGTTPTGRITDLGGRYLTFSDDNGVSWLQAQPTNPLVNAEGAVAWAPNGDIVGVTWDPYGGDRLYAYKYDAAAQQWLYLQNPDTPFYDRPEIAVIPGPLTVPVTGGGTQSVPYISLVSSHGSPVSYSTDGLSYTNLVGDGSSSPVTQWLPHPGDPNLDWVQSQTWSNMRALGGGWALDYSGGGGAEDYNLTDNLSSSSLLLFNPSDLALHPLTLPGASFLTKTSTVQVDSLGRIHGIAVHSDRQGFDYDISADGGQTWATLSVSSPPFEKINSNTGGDVFDLRVDAHLGIAALVTRTDVGSASNPPGAGDPEQDYVYKFDISGPTASLLTRYNVGLGNTTVDTAYLGSYETGGHRYDFASIALLPDGRVVTSFMDESTHMPFPSAGNDIEASAVAIEQPSQEAVTPESPWAAALPLTAGAVLVAGISLRRRRLRRAR